MLSMTRLLAVTICCGVPAIVACTPQPGQPGGESARAAGATVAAATDTAPGPTLSGDTGSDARARLAALEQQARAMVKTDGCADSGGCRTAPVGWRGCGGPRTYLGYCAATTDTAALFRKLKELEVAERAYNATAHVVSTCEFRLPPKVASSGGSCREVPSAP